MFESKFGTFLPTAVLALCLSLASATIGQAQISLTPPPIPEQEAPQADGTATPPPPPSNSTAATTTPPPPPPAERFFVSTDGSTEGPFLLSELEAQLNAGTFSETTYVWQDGMADWLPAGDVTKLDALLASARTDTDNPEPTIDIGLFLVGVWEDKNTAFVEGLGQIQLDMLIEYYQDGKMDGIGTFTSMTNGTRSVYDVYIEGTWRAQSTGNNMFDLTTQSKVSIGLVQSPVYTDFFDMDDTVSFERTGPNTMRDVADNLTYTRYR